MRIILALMVLLFVEIILETGFRINSTLGAGISVKNILIYPLFLFAIFKWHNESVVYKDAKFNRLLVYYLAFIAYCIFTLTIPLLFSIPNYDFRQGALNFKEGLIDPFLCFIIFWVFTKRQLKNPGLILKLLLVIVAIFCVLMLAERMVPSIEMYGVDDKAGLRLNGPFGEPNQTAAVLSLCLPMVVSLIFTHGNTRVIYAATAVLFLLCILITGSRGGILGAGIGCLYLLWTIRAQLPMSNKILMIVTVPVLVVLTWVILPESSRELLLARFSFVNESDIDWEDASAGRTYLWQVGWDLWKQSPIFGQGWSSFMMLSGVASHNIYLDYLVSLGIVGLAIALSLYWRVFFFYENATNIHSGHVARLLLTGTCAGVISLLVSLFFVNLYIPWITVWCLLGAAAGYCSALKTLDRIRTIRIQSNS